jgi:hypothetical protein
MRTDLKVPFSEKDEAKNLGARWDGIRKTWYIENSSFLPNFAKWLPLPPSSEASDAFKSKTLEKVGDSGPVMVGNTHSPRLNACDCTLMWECEHCRNRQRLG